MSLDVPMTEGFVTEKFVLEVKRFQPFHPFEYFQCILVGPDTGKEILVNCIK